MQAEKDPLDAAVEELEAAEAAATAERVNDKLDRLDSHVTMLRAMGIEVQVVLHVGEDEAKHSLEVGPADCRSKIYYKDLEDLRSKLRLVAEAKEEAARLGLTVPPKQPRGGQ